MSRTPPIVRSNPIEGVEDLYHTYSPQSPSQPATPYLYIPSPQHFTTADQQRQIRGSLGGEPHNGPRQFPPHVPPFARYSYFAFEPRERPPFHQYQTQDVPRDNRYDTEGTNMSGYQVDPRLAGGNMMPSPSGSRSMGSISSNVGGYSNENTPSSAGFPGMGGAHPGSRASHSPTEAPAAGDQQPADHKRQRACEGCRQLKVRCEPDPENPQGTCRRCAKAHRECIFTAPTRKRQKRTDSRVAELEKKIDQLTASLAARRRGEIIDEDSEGSEDGDAGIETSSWKPNRNAGRRAREESLDANSQGSAAKRQRTDRDDGQENKAEGDGSERPVPVPNLYPFLMPSKPSVSKSTALPTPDAEGSTCVTSPPQSLEYLDVIDRRLLTMDLATKIFDKYQESYVLNMPAVTFPRGTTASEIRKTKPFLFLSIIAVASMTFNADLCRTLNKEFVKSLAERVIVNGEKSLEIVQALLVAVLWFHPPEHFEELKFYQFAHMCAVMAIDIGLSRKSRPLRSKITDPGPPGTPTPPIAHGFANALQGIPGLHGLNSINESLAGDGKARMGKDHMWRDHPWRKNPFPDPSTLESRVTFLACYFICQNTSLTLRRPNLIRFSSYITECIEVIETSSEATEGQRLMAHLVKIHRIAEEVGIAFSYDDPYSKVNVSDSRVEFQLKGFERQVEEWRKELSKFSPGARMRLNLSNHLIWLYMHEVALHVDHAADDFRPPFAEDTVPERPQEKRHDSTLSQFHIDSIFTCYTAAHSYIDHFISFTVDEIRTFPAMMFVRTAYSLVVLMKLLFSSGQPRSELGRVVDKKALGLERYIEKLQGIFKVVAENEKSKAAQKFAMILAMLSTWYSRQKTEKDAKRKGEMSIPALLKVASKLKELKEAGALDDILSGDMNRALPGGNLPPSVEQAIEGAEIPSVVCKVLQQALIAIGGIPPMLLYIVNTGTIPPIAQPILQQVLTTGVIPPHIQAFMASGGFSNFPEALKGGLNWEVHSQLTPRSPNTEAQNNNQGSEQQQQQQTQQQQSAHTDPMDAPTPLHMLSDVAMGTEDPASSLHGGSLKSVDDGTPSFGANSPGDVNLFDGTDDIGLGMGMPIDYASMLGFGGMNDFGLGMLDPGSFMPMADDAFWGQDPIGDPSQLYSNWP